MKFLTPIDHSGLESLNFRFQLLATPPGSPTSGRAYYDSVTNGAYIYNGTAFISTDAALVPNGHIPLAKVNGAAPLASPTFTGLVTTPAGSTSQAGGLKLTSGTLKTTPVAGDSGSIEYNGTTLSFIDATGTRRVLGVSGSGIQSVTLTQPSAGFTITPAGTSNDPTFTFDLTGDLAAIEALTGNGIVRRTGADTWTVGGGVNLTTEVTGTLPVGNGGTGETTATGTGAIVKAVSPALTGTPTAPTAAADTNTTQLATTEFVLNQASAATPAALGTASAGAATRWSRGDHVHAMPRLDQVLNPTASVNLNSQLLTNVADPVSATDGANKRYVDSRMEGLAWKDEVHAATVSNVATLAGGAPSVVDGVTLVLGDRVLVKSQSTPSQNGIYTVTTLGTGSNGTWTRSTDADTSPELAGAAVFVSDGTVEKGRRYTTNFARTDTVGSSAVNWVVFAGGSTLTGSTSVSITADVIAVIAAPSGGLSIGGTGVGVDTAIVVRKYAATIGDNSATSIVVTHSLGTQDITLSVREVSSQAGVMCDWVATSTTTATLTFAVAPASNSLRVVVHG